MLRIIGEWKLESMDRRLARFGDQARVLARRLGRGEIEIEIDARRVRAPREVLAPLWAAFAHLIRNSVDHGMTAESMRQPGDRKPKLRLAARASATHVTIEVSDNGRGIDWEIVRGKAASRGLPHETQEDLESALFDDGFSTADQVTEISGRGVGLAAVREAVLALNGQIIVMSEPGVGTTFELSIPTASLAPRRFSRLPPRSIPVAANH
jgi:two-component system chemotaxis sensor kinase CheA